MHTTAINTVGAGLSKIWYEVQHYQIKTRPSQNAMKSLIDRTPKIWYEVQHYQIKTRPSQNAMKSLIDRPPKIHHDQ